MSLIDRLALGALDAAEASAAEADAVYEEEKYAPQWQEAAHDLVRASPLAGWFPLNWRLVDHNLPKALREGSEEVVVVTADPEDETRTPLRFIVRRWGGVGGLPQYQLAIADPDSGPGRWHLDAIPVGKVEDVGAWVRKNRQP